eukprot:299930-Chlamydomonas_euryale.AAC.1
MLMAHSHRPAAARDLVQIASRLKCSSARYGRVASTVFFDTWPASITFLKSLSRSRNLSTLPMSFCAACHDLSCERPSPASEQGAQAASAWCGGAMRAAYACPPFLCCRCPLPAALPPTPIFFMHCTMLTRAPLPSPPLRRYQHRVNPRSLS